MPRRKPKPEVQIQAKIKETLDSIVSAENFGLESIDSSDLPRLKSSVILDFELEKTTVATDAKLLLDKMVDFYLDADLIGEDDHIEYKKKMDAMNLSSMLLQLKTSQHTIIKIMEEIDLGNMQPRLIEVLVQLQSQIMQMPKDYQNYLEKMEDSYKRMKNDYGQKKLRGGITLDEDGNVATPINGEQPQGIRVRGNKGLMENLRDILGSDIEDVTIDDLDENSIVNAREKLKIDKDKNPNGQEGEDSSEYDIEDDLFNT